MTEKQYIDKSQWTELPGAVRYKLRQRFLLPITERTEVINDRVISDGVTTESLRSVFSVSSMRTILSAEDGTCDELFARIVEAAKVDQLDSVLAPMTDEAPTESAPVKVEKPKKIRTRK